METIEKIIGSPVPLERLPLPADLDGRWGCNRGSALLQIDAKTDLEAVQTWLAEFEHSPHTWRNYRKEVERLLLWSLLERGKPLSSLTREDLAAFEAFLADPTPRERWCGPRALRRSTHWRPFQGPLSEHSCRQTLTIINSLFTYLVDAGYLAGNPLALRRRREGSNVKVEAIERFLDPALWQHVLSFVEGMPRETDRQQAEYERVRYLLTLLYLLGPRVGEVVSHSMGSFIEVRGKWWWQVTGKGRKTARIPVNQEMLGALARYRVFYGLPPLPMPGEETPLVLSLKGSRGISANMVYRIVKAVMKKAADTLEASQFHQAHKLRKASTHWLRHTAITHQADAGIELRYLNKSARHAKLETTAIYLHADEDRWHEAMEKHKIQD
ncbi:tyrosine-type recombinase/integrase [Nitrosococcus wardiae]|uniref:Integrase n=1 Tax=Nitrosococcus wardiae TaxID=1814290 RepID=A0A4P7C399_9GAMM|nr:tyrosine-type recombinase/integrase [Nitrosococcus wardiae]QBQ55376.1 integrase [Nitrosococcus wardiae]